MLPMSSSEKFPLSRAALAAAVMGVAAFYAVATLTEWWPIAVARDTVHIATYHFGSASTLEHGGWRYANPEVYAWTCFAEALAALATLPMLWRTIVRRSRKAAFALVIVCAVYLGASLVLGRVHWSPRNTLLRSKVIAAAL
jgi:hypothetical protein